MKNHFILIVVATLFLTLNSCSDGASNTPTQNRETITFNPYAFSALDQEIYDRQTDPHTVLFTGEMVRLTDNNHLIPLLPCGGTDTVLADMVNDNQLYADFQNALTAKAAGQTVTVKYFIQDNLFYKDKFVITEFQISVIIPDTVPPTPFVIDTPYIAYPDPMPIEPVRPKKVSKKNNCGCCSTVTVNSTTATVTVNNGTATVVTDSTATK